MGKAHLARVVQRRYPTHRLMRAEVAQSVEHRPEEAGVVSSILTLGTTNALSLGAQAGGSGSVGRASPCQGEGRGFESRLPLHFPDLTLPGGWVASRLTC
jgi:hypothetical protein